MAIGVKYAIMQIAYCFVVWILVTSYENPQLVNSLDIRYVPSRTNYSYADQ